MLFEVRSAIGEPEAEVAVEHAVELKNRGFRPKSIGADKGYPTAGFAAGAPRTLRPPGPTGHPAQSGLHGEPAHPQTH